MSSTNQRAVAAAQAAQSRLIYIEQREEQIKVLDEKTPSLKKIRRMYDSLAVFPFVLATAALRPFLGEYHKQLCSILSDLFAGYADQYRIELETIAKIKANWAAEKAALTSPIQQVSLGVRESN